MLRLEVMFILTKKEFGTASEKVYKSRGVWDAGKYYLKSRVVLVPYLT